MPIKNLEALETALGLPKGDFEKLKQIDAEIKREKETRGNGNRVLRSERYQGSISRSFSLSQDVEEGKAKARYADGVLTLELPKKTSATARKVQIQ